MKEINMSEIEDFYNRQGIHSDFEMKEFDVEIYHKNHIYKPSWVGFYNGIADGSTEAISAVSMLDSENINNSVVCFVFNSESIYAICNGYGANSIARYCDPIYGLEISSRLGCPIESVKSLKENELTGNVLAATQIFRKDHILIESDAIGKLYKEIEYRVSNKFMFDKMNIGEPKKDGSIRIGNCGVRVGTAFRLNKELTFSEVNKLLKYLEEVKNKDREYELTNLIRLNKRNKKDKELSDKLESLLLSSIYTSFRTAEAHNLELIHSNFEEYDNAQRYEVYFNNKKEPILVLESKPYIDELKVLFYKDDKIVDEGEFLENIGKYRLVSTNNNGDILTDGTVISHIVGEASIDDTLYFIIDNNWYSMKNNLIESLNKDVLNLVQRTSLNKLNLDDWVNGDEDTYNASYIGKTGFVVTHKILYNNIEVADFIQVVGNKVRLYHVKKGFDASMRDLSSQISNAARIVQSAIQSNEDQYEFAEIIYETMVSRKQSDNGYLKRVGQQTDGFSKVEFINMFRGKSLEYCLVIKHNGSLLKPKESRSCIAKFSIVELITRMNGYMIDLSIEEV